MTSAHKTASVVVGIVALLFSTTADGLEYWRCEKPPDACIAFTEADKAECPECKEWVRVFLDFSTVLKNARKEQKEAGVSTERVGSNFFLDAASEQIYGFDLTTTAGAPPKTRQVYNDPEKFGLEVVPNAEVKAGTLAVVGDVAGVVTEADGKLVITYASGRRGDIRIATPETLAEAEKTPVKYVAPAQRRE